MAAEIADDLHVVRHDNPRLLQLRQLERLVEIQPHAAQRHAVARAKDAAAHARGCNDGRDRASSGRNCQQNRHAYAKVDHDAPRLASIALHTTGPPLGGDRASSTRPR